MEAIGLPKREEIGKPSRAAARQRQDKKRSHTDEPVASTHPLPEYQIGFPSVVSKYVSPAITPFFGLSVVVPWPFCFARWRLTSLIHSSHSRFGPFSESK